MSYCAKCDALKKAESTEQQQIQEAELQAVAALMTLAKLRGTNEHLAASFQSLVKSSERLQRTLAVL